LTLFYSELDQAFIILRIFNFKISIVAGYAHCYDV